MATYQNFCFKALVQLKDVIGACDLVISLVIKTLGSELFKAFSHIVVAPSAFHSVSSTVWNDLALHSMSVLTLS